MAIDDDTIQLGYMLTNLAGQCDVEIHHLTDLRDYVTAIKRRLADGKQPTLKELETLFKMNDLAMNHKSVLGAIRNIE